MGQLKEAKEIGMQIMKASTNQQGSEHYLTLNGMFDLARAYHVQRQLKTSRKFREPGTGTETRAL
ncbi:hypothetical protein ACJ72_01885 [Emergomyces africanus]|uniref:Uncharacterized protein n=1 Tax=Emergomyces africanus TaxID=1955775 RepID=A0A1B7P3Y3_9EURO|nr:hypothetical protein ACJ72_01885 [Emergomyces africanus]